jgi:hypothetical protein
MEARSRVQYEEAGMPKHELHYEYNRHGDGCEHWRLYTTEHERGLVTIVRTPESSFVRLFWLGGQQTDVRGLAAANRRVQEEYPDAPPLATVSDQILSM